MHKASFLGIYKPDAKLWFYMGEKQKNGSDQ